MHPHSTVMSHIIPSEEPIPPPTRGKRAVRVLVSLTHITIALLLLATVILNIFTPRGTIFILYLVPFVILTLVIEICHLRHKPIPPRISKQFCGLLTLKLRSFTYQVAAVLGAQIGNRGDFVSCWRGEGGVCGCITHLDPILLAIRISSWVAWSLAVGLFVLAIVSKECGFEDWVEVTDSVEEGKGVQLMDSDSESGDLVGSGEVSRV